MKIYQAEDFKTHLAKHIAGQVIPQTNWGLLAAYNGTDILEKATIAAREVAAQTGIIPMDGIPDSYGSITLSNGQIVAPAQVNAYALEHGKYTYLKVLEIFEDTFDETTKLETIFTNFVDEPDPLPGELNFAISVKMYPAEATQLYFAFRYPDQMKNGFAYQHIQSHINQKLIENGITVPGPSQPPLDAFEATALIAQGWGGIAHDLDNTIIPWLNKVKPGKQGGPPMH